MDLLIIKAHINILYIQQGSKKRKIARILNTHKRMKRTLSNLKKKKKNKRRGKRVSKIMK